MCVHPVYSIYFACCACFVWVESLFNKFEGLNHTKSNPLEVLQCIASVKTLTKIPVIKSLSGKVAQFFKISLDFCESFKYRFFFKIPPYGCYLCHLCYLFEQVTRFNLKIKILKDSF